MASISRVILLDMIEKQLKVQPMSRVQIMGILESRKQLSLIA